MRLTIVVLAVASVAILLRVLFYVRMKVALVHDVGSHHGSKLGKNCELTLRYGCLKHESRISSEQLEARSRMACSCSAVCGALTRKSPDDVPMLNCCMSVWEATQKLRCGERRAVYGRASACARSGRPHVVITGFEESLRERVFECGGVGEIGCTSMNFASFLSA